QTKKAIIIDAPNGKSSLSTEENVGFWIDEAAKTITLEDGTPLIVRRFGDRWIGAARDDVSYELDRQDDILTYASSTTKDGVTTIIIGYGRCKPPAGPPIASPSTYAFSAPSEPTCQSKNRRASFHL